MSQKYAYKLWVKHSAVPVWYPLRVNISCGVKTRDLGQTSAGAAHDFPSCSG